MPGIWETKTFMPRQPRQLKPNFCYHITVRCNNRDFRLTRLECKEVLLYAIDVLGKTLEMCAAIYRKFCQRYRPQPKPEKKNYWGSRLLDKIKKKGKPQKTSPGQMNLWDKWELSSEIHEVAKEFIAANTYIPRLRQNTSVPGIGALK